MPGIVGLVYRTSRQELKGGELLAAKSGLRLLRYRCTIPNWSCYVLVELSFCEVVAEQVAEGQAVQTVAVAGNSEVVLVSVHVSHHAADIE